ncbi:uncharacterized protein LOC111700995 [Eurytemora carolleeae]|uniref:uncharacterized protein LOC111700995 n=1 Tax=Eurytemora carolleeae TaxID=1294199 RepID=UPI000C772223|nr:uncharacterized protein LOC111700995 [Eurytemora carolleeae]|eukprot:XP_023327867.1 uncharacterized protein LOC111700995 [Eurytemora affinis]
MAAANVGTVSHGKPSILPGRRHSIAVGQSTPTFGASTTRRKSIQDSIHHLTHNMSIGLRIALRTSRDCLQLNDETVFDKVLSRRMLSNHFKEKDLRVIKFVSSKKEDLENGEQHDVEIWIKREDGHKKKLDIQVRVHREEEMEAKVYNIIITKLREYVLSKKQRRSSFLCTPEHFLISDPSIPRFLEDSEEQDVCYDDVNSGFENKIMVLENLPMKGYRTFISLLGVSALDASRFQRGKDSNNT